MPYPDLPPNPTFWRCPQCGNESRFRASGIGHVECTACGGESTVERLKETHAKATTAAPAS
jgi:hypothetical protein